ncbi:hypothetical protein ACFX2A_016928 [Malus domestica]
MADVVQYRMERMLPELDDLEKEELFTRRELAEIVKQRRNFEFRLKRPSPLKEDYLAYIDYETKVDKLRCLRKKAKLPEREDDEETKMKKKRKRKSVSDFAGVRRILDIYRLAVTRFTGDLELWFRYLDFCKERRNGRIKEVLNKVIGFHSKQPSVWIYKAAWEFDNYSNVEAARNTMLQGLRFCKNSEDLWIEYLRMELTFLNKLKARKVALGEDEGSLVRDKISADEQQWKSENKDLYMPLNEERENDDNNEGSDIEESKSTKKVDKLEEVGFGVIKTIYSEAVKSLPSSFTLRKRFLEILEPINLAKSGEMREEVLSDMKRDFSTEPEYWDWLAKFEYSPASTQEEMSEEVTFSRIGKAIQVYEDAIKVLPLAIMFKHYAKFLMGTVALLIGDNKPSLDSQSASYMSHLLGLYQKADTIGCTNEELACEHISIYLQLGRVDEARKLAQNLCCGKFPNSAKVRVLWASIEMKHFTRDLISPSKDTLLSIFELVKDGLTRLSISEAESLWVMALKFFASQKHYFDMLVEVAVTSLIEYRGSDEGFSLSSVIVNFVLQKDGIAHAREMYKRFTGLPRPGLVLYRTCIELETNLASNGDKTGLENARKLYFSALQTYDQDSSLWRDFWLMETKMGTSKTASYVSWRAHKTLKDSSALSLPDL